MENLFTGNGAEVWQQDNMLEPDKQLVPGSDRTAALAALATADMSNPDLLTTIRENTEKIKSLQSEREIRKSLALQEAQARVQAFVDLQAKAQSPEEQDAVVAGFNQVLARDTAEEEKYIIEKKAVENIQDYITSGDINMAQQLLRNQDLGSVMDVKRDYETKYAVLRRMAEEAGIAKEDQSWFSDAVDFVLNEIITLKKSMGSVGNVDVKDSVTRWYDNFLSGGRQQAEADALVGMPLEEFMQYVNSDLLTNIKENTTFLGIHNQTAELNILSNLVNPKAVDVVNLGDAFTNVTGAGFMGGLKVAKGIGKAGLSIPGMIIRQGGRKEIGELLGKATMDMAAEGSEGAAKTALTPDEVVDNIVPSGMSVNGVDATVSPVARVQAFIDRARELAQKIPELLETSRFMNNEELMAAAKKQADQLAETAGRDLVDWKVVPVRLAGGQKTYQIEATLGRMKPGEPPVGTPKAAAAAEAPTEKVTAQLLSDAGFTQSEIREWQAGSTSMNKMAQQALEGWAYFGRGWAKATLEDVSKFKESIQKEIDDLLVAKQRQEEFQRTNPDQRVAWIGDGKSKTPAENIKEIDASIADRNKQLERADRIGDRVKARDAKATEVPAPDAETAEVVQAGTKPIGPTEVSQSTGSGSKSTVAKPTSSGPADDPDWFIQHRDDFAGVTIYRNDQIGLIRASNALTGRPVYIPVKGKLRARVDVDSFTGDLFTPEEMAELKAAKQASEGLDANAFLDAPNGPFKSEAGEVAVSKSIPNDLKNFVTQLLNDVGLSNKRFFVFFKDDVLGATEHTVIGGQSLIKAPYGLNGPFRSVYSAALDAGESGSLRAFGPGAGDFYISLDPKLPRDQLVQIVSHEIGHAIDRVKFKQASPEIQEAIKAEHAAWVAKTKGLSAKELIVSLRGPSIGSLHGRNLSDSAGSEVLSGYWTSFGEWFADQTARWATTNEVPTSPVQMFFKDVADTLKQLWELLKNTKIFKGDEYVAPNMKKFLEGLRNDPTLGEDLGIVPPDNLFGSSKAAVPEGGMELTVGTPQGLGFKTEAGARRSMNKLGYDQAEIFQDEAGQWFGRIRKNLTEQGFYSNELKVQVDSAAWKLLSSSNVSDENLAGMARLAGNKKAAVMEQVIKPLAQIITKPKGRSRILVEQIVAKGMTDQKWYTDDELNILSHRVNKRDMTAVEREAYRAYQKLNDWEWALRNDEVYKSKVVAGYESVEFDTSLGKINLQDARVDENLDNIPQQRVYDVNNGVHYTTERPLTDGELALKKGQNYVVVKLREAQKMADGTYVQNFLVRRSEMSRRPLERTQLGYVPGGHRMYQGDHFVKQAQRAVQPDTGKELLLAPKTFIVGTRQEAKSWAAGMEAARVAFKESAGKITADEIDSIFSRYKGFFPDGEQFLDHIKTGKISENEAFEAVFDRELPATYRDVDPNSIAFAPDEPGYNGWLVTSGRMYTGQKGSEALVDYMGNAAPTLDPFRTADQALSNIANIMSFSDYKISSAERWARAFKKYTDYAKRDDLTSDLAILRDAQFRPDTPNNIRMAGEAQRDIIKRNVGWKSESDLIGEQASRRMAEFIFGNEPGTLRAKTERIVTDWWNETNPVVALRSAAFDMKLGLFNVAQVPLQATTSFAAVALSPKFGAQGFMVFPVLRAYLFNGNEAILDHLIKSGGMKTLGYEDAASFKAMMKTARQSGFFNIGNTHELIRAGGTSTAMSSFGNLVDDIRETGRVFFHEAEIMNRSVAWNIAWQETKAALPDAAINSPEFLRRVSLEADRYSFFMTKESEAWWQRGVLSIPTQFWGYQARMLEAMFGKSFTAEQKIRLIAQQSLMYGTAGVPLVPFITDYIKEKTGKPSDINTFWGVADRGLLDFAMANITGADVSYGAKIGTGGWLSDTIKDFFNAGPYGEKSMAEVIGGATFGILGQTGGIALDAFKHSVAESGGDVGGDKDPESFIKLAKQISTVNNALKAYWVFQYGTYLTTSGQVIAKDLPTVAGIATLMGFNPAEVDNASIMIQFNKKQTEIVNDAAKVVAKYRTRMISEPENRDEYAREVSAFIRRFPPDVRQRILMKTNRDFDPSLYDGLVKQMEQRTKE